MQRTLSSDPSWRQPLTYQVVGVVASPTPRGSALQVQADSSKAQPRTRPLPPHLEAQLVSWMTPLFWAKQTTGMAVARAPRKVEMPSALQPQQPGA
jgi:hypothetical protein